MWRTPAMVGSFYPAQPETLKAEVARPLCPRQMPQAVKAIVSSHVGLVYSGAVACSSRVAGSLDAELIR